MYNTRQVIFYLSLFFFLQCMDGKIVKTQSVDLEDLLKSEKLFQAHDFILSTITNNVYIVHNQSMRYVALLNISEKMYRLYVTFAERAVGPKVIFYDANKQILVTEYFCQKKHEPHYGHKIHLTSFINSLRTLHTTKIDQLTKHSFCKELVLKKSNNCNTVLAYLSEMEMSFLYEILKQYDTYLEKTGFYKQEQVVVHGDLHPFNIFFGENEQYSFIDFEAVHYDSPFIDLAYVSFCFSMDEATEKEFIEGYFGHSMTEAELISITIIKCFVAVHLINYLTKQLAQNAQVNHPYNPQYNQSFNVKILKKCIQNFIFFSKKLNQKINTPYLERVLSLIY